MNLRQVNYLCYLVSITFKGYTCILGPPFFVELSRSAKQLTSLLSIAWIFGLNTLNVANSLYYHGHSYRSGAILKLGCSRAPHPPSTLLDFGGARLGRGRESEVCSARLLGMMPTAALRLFSITFWLRSYFFYFL